jgi:TonB family protein
MEDYLIYIGKTAIAAGAFYLAYLVLFQNKKQFAFNRVYLPVTLAISFIIPLITFTTVKYIEAPEVVSASYSYLAPAAEIEVISQSVRWWPHYLSIIYLLGAMGFLLHLISGHLKAIQITRGSQVMNLYGCRVHVTEKDVHPFSFFNKIVISRKTLNCPNLRMIVDHENIHVQEKHTLDILLTEVLFILQWFNPFVWLIKDAVKNNLEYKTDDEIIKLHNRVTYQLAMVSLADKKGVAPFLTALNGSQLKNRIIMMKKIANNRYGFLKQLVILPLLAVLIMGLSERVVKTEFIQEHQSIQIQEEPTTETTAPAHEKNELLAVTELQKVQLPDTSSAKPLQLNSSGAVIHYKDIFTSPVPDTTKEPIWVVDGKISKTITQVPPGDIAQIDVLKGQSASALFGPEGRNGVVIITTKSKSYTHYGDSALIVRPQPQEKFFLPDEMPEYPGGEQALRQYISNNISYPQIARDNGIHGTSYVTVTITKEGKVTGARLARGVDPALDAEAIRVVGSLPDWKPAKHNGQLVDASYTIPVKFELKDNIPKVQRMTDGRVIPGTLYIVDGEERHSIKDIPPGDIKRIEVLNRETSLAQYGQKGKDGVILITTIQGANRITSELELRRFIANQIKYPLEAHKNGLHGTVTMIIDIGKSNEIISEQNNIRNDIYNVSEVVVVGYSDDTAPVTTPVKNAPLLLKEVERVVQMLPKVDIPAIGTRQIRITVEFKLQSGE